MTKRKNPSGHEKRKVSAEAIALAKQRRRGYLIANAAGNLVQIRHVDEALAIIDKLHEAVDIRDKALAAVRMDLDTTRAQYASNPWLIQHMLRDYALALDRMGIGLDIKMPWLTFRTGAGELQIHVEDALRQGMYHYFDLLKKLPGCIGEPKPTYEGKVLDLEALAEGRPQPSEAKGKKRTWTCQVSMAADEEPEVWKEPDPARVKVAQAQARAGQVSTVDEILRDLEPGSP